MAWETRSGTKIRFYYRGTRVDGRVRKVCYGSGRRAAHAARQDAEARAARAADAAAARAAEAELEPLERLSVETDEQVDLLVEALLLAGGLHQHRGQWRRKRHGSRTNDSSSSSSSATDRGGRGDDQAPGYDSDLAARAASAEPLAGCPSPGTSR